MSNKKYKCIKIDTVVDIKVTGAFYADLKAAIFELTYEGETSETVAKILKNIQDSKVTSPKEKALFVMMSVASQIEVDADAQNKITEEDAPPVQSDSPN